MGLFSRLGQMVRGFFGLFISGLEKSNPDAIFEDIKNQIDKARREANDQIIEIQTNAELIKVEMKQAEKNLQAVAARVISAKATGDEEILVEILMQEEEIQQIYEAHKATFENATADVTKIRGDFKMFESEMTQKLNDLKSLKTQNKLASLKENINSINSKYTAKGNRIGNINESLEKARDLVNQKTARANAIGSLNEDNIDMKLKRLDANSARERAKARAQAMISGTSGAFEVKEKVEEKAGQQ